MKIVQLIANNLPNTSYRYAIELNNQLVKFNIDAEIISLDNIDFNDDIINILNSYEYCFIHSLPKIPSIYGILLNKIKIKKILFITDINIKQWHNSISLSNIGNLLRGTTNIVINELATDIINEISRLIGENNFKEKFVNLKFIYDFSNISFNSIDYKKNEISLISNKGIRSNYELFIKLFEKFKEKNLIWHIYGVTKNIQTMSVNNLYINKETNQKSLLTNFSNEILTDKINVHEPIDDQTCNDIISNNLFIANFDITNILSYTLIDIIGHGSIPILNEEIAKKIKINKSQSLYDLKCGIFINSKTLDENINIQINKLLLSKNSYIQMLNKNINMFKQLFNAEQIVNNLLLDLQIK